MAKKKELSVDGILKGRNALNPMGPAQPSQFTYKPPVQPGRRVMGTDTAPGVTVPPPNTFQTAKLTDAMMGGGANLTPAERQMILTETFKGSIANRMRGDAPGRYNLPEGMSPDQWNKLGMHERAAISGGTREDSEKAVAEGRATMQDLLAAGERRSAYGGFGTVKEEVDDSRMISGPRGRGVQVEGTRARNRDRTEQEFLDEFNDPNLRMFEESRAIQQALTEDEAQREHETGLAQLKLEGAAGKATIDSEAKKRSDRIKSIEASADNINNLYASLADSVIPENTKAIRARIGLAERQHIKNFGGEASAISAPEGGQPSLDQAGFIADFTAETGVPPTQSQIQNAQGKYWK